MTLKIDLTPELEGRLQEEAAKVGLAAEQYVLKALEERLRRRRNEAAASLLAAWRREDATNDPAELEARRRSWEAVKAALDEDRFSDRKLFP